MNDEIMEFDAVVIGVIRNSRKIVCRCGSDRFVAYADTEMGYSIGDNVRVFIKGGEHFIISD